MKRRLLALVMLPILLNTSGGRAFAALSEQKVVNTLSKLKPFANGRKMNVQTSGEQVSISLVRAKGATDKDLKIEALMAAKSLLDVEPSVLAVTMRFFDDRQPRHYVEVYVTSAEVKAFGSGMVSSDDLLTSLRTTEGATAAAPSTPASGAPAAPPAGVGAAVAVVSGPLFDERADLIARIEALQAKGVGVRIFKDRFAALEQMAQANDEENLKAAYEALERNVAAQEVATAAALPAAVHNVLTHAGVTGGGTPGHAGSTPNSLEELFTGMMYGAQDFRVSHPWCYPAEGPYRQQRGAIAHQLFVLKMKGYDINQYKKYFVAMEQYAATRQRSALEQSIKNLYAALHIGSSPF
ncbi:MAG: hypothetical protein U0105_08660 [Candidatus Obscuribacterales bacterium]|jgi:hypothetical protein